MADLSSLPPLREVIRRHSLRAEKKLGQNFLLDLNLTDKIVRAAGDLSGCHVYEIGPGPGGLTRSLLKSHADKITAIEFDPRAIQALQDLKNVSGERFELVQADALTIDLVALSAPPRAIVANLPYNISTTLLIGWLECIYKDADAFQSMTLMFQREVAERITAAHNSKSYGRLAVLSQWLCDVQIMFDVPASAFTPPPKVVSSIVKLTPKKNLKNKPDFKYVEKITAAAFGQRRKMIRSSLKEYQPYFSACELEETLRAENVSVEKFIELALTAQG